MLRQIPFAHNPLVWLLVIAASIGGLLVTALVRQYDSSIDLFRLRHEQQTRELQDDVDKAVAVINGLQIAAGSHLRHSASITSENLDAIGPVPGTDGYGLVGLETPADSMERLNLTGLGAYDTSTTEQELGAALELEPVFRWVKEIYPDAPWVYYLSDQRFMAVYPFIPFDSFFMDDAFFEMDLYRLGDPNTNPQREHYITPVYEDEAGQGLMVTIGAPVYRDDGFTGIVGFDLTIAALSSVLQAYHHQGDVQYLVQEGGQVIARAGLPSESDERGETRPLDSYVADLQSRLSWEPGDSSFFHDGRYFHASQLSNTPWVLISERSRWNVLGDSVVATLPLLMLILVLVAGVMMYVRERHSQERMHTENALRRERDNLQNMVDEQTHDLKKAKESAEAATEAKSSFLANMSHEIRTPLHAVLGFARIGEEESHEPISRGRFEKIVASGEFLLRVLNDVLDLSKIEGGHLTLVRAPFELRRTIQNALAIVDEQAEKKSLILTGQTDPTLPDWVMGDEIRLQQILLNLLSNAIKYTEHGRITLDVSREADRVRMSVADTGIGIGREQMDRLFRPFEQGDNSTTRVHGGTGLGLFITENLVELMGGEISVSSESGQGSEFVVRLPLPVAERPADVETAWSESNDRQLQGLQALVVDDDPINRKLLGYLLSREGAETSFANNGREALDAVEQAEAGDLDLVLMDIQMPLMDGYEATRRIRAIDPALPIIGLTAHAFAEDGRKCIEVGMAAHLTKPCAPEDLVATIRRHTG